LVLFIFLSKFRLKDFALRGYVLDNVRLKNWAYLSKQYFKDLILEIRDIRESEFEKYRPIQDRLFESDFDREIKKLLDK